jgi:peptide/nickel transport system permease protein
MKWYIFRRLVWTVVASFIILTVTFLLMELVPNQQVEAAKAAALAEGQTTEAAAQAEREALGLDEPIYVRYVDFITNIFSGDWGWSVEQNRPVKEVVVESVPYSLMYFLPATILSSILGTVIGLYSAINQNTWKDYTATFGAFFGVSIPNWWFGIILLVIFGSWLGWVELEWTHQLAKTADGNFVWYDTAPDTHPAFRGEEFSGERPIGILSWPNIKQLILPTFVLMTGAIANVMRFARAEALEYVDSDFVKTAKAKGVSSRAIVAKHIFRPASVPLVTIFVGRLLGLVLAGSYLIEVVFGIPGIGLVSYNAIIAQDVDVVMITILLPTLLVIFGNLVEDLLYPIIDPRINYGDR